MINLQSIKKSANIISSSILRFPLLYSPALSNFFECDIYLKTECLQQTGSFKIRGAASKLHILKQTNSIGPKGVVAASAGNHAQGVALAASQAGVPSVIVMPEWVSITKQEATKNYGGQVLIHGGSVKESLEKANELSQTGMTFVHPFDDPDIIAGQGTVGLEIFEDLSNPDYIISPVGGGGLISGIACAANAIRPETKIIGVQACACPACYESYHKGKIVSVALQPSIADGISVMRPGKITFSIIKKYINEIVTVDEKNIASAILMFLEKAKLLTEGAGAVALAALISNSVKLKKGSKIVLVVSGGNVDSPLLGRIINKGLIKNNRILQIRIDLNDVPGALHGLLKTITELKANILHIRHDRQMKSIPINMSMVELELETRDHLHMKKIIMELKKSGFRVHNTIDS